MSWCKLDRDSSSCWDSWSALLSCMIQCWSHLYSFCSYVSSVLWKLFDYNLLQLAFFTTREIEAMEELTWVCIISQSMIILCLLISWYTLIWCESWTSHSQDYGVDFNNENYLMKPFDCQCGSRFCRAMKRSKSEWSSQDSTRVCWFFYMGLSNINPASHWMFLTFVLFQRPSK